MAIHMICRTNPDKGPWWSLHAVTFLKSQTVREMTMAERGIYITLLNVCWRDGSIPWDAKELAHELRIDTRTMQSWMAKFGKLTGSLREIDQDSDVTHVNIPEVVFPNQQILSMKMGKTRLDKSLHTDITNTYTDRQNRVNAEVSVLETETKTKTPVPEPSKVPVQRENERTFSVPRKAGSPVPVPRKGFDPLTFDGDVDPVPSSNFPRRETYPGDEVHRILLYHFKHEPSDYWTDPAKGNVTSDIRLSRVINAMAAQVPDEWIPPVAKEPITRLIGDASCRACRGRGKVTREQSNGDRHSVPCTGCKPRQQVAKGREWVDV